MRHLIFIFFGTILFSCGPSDASKKSNAEAIDTQKRNKPISHRVIKDSGDDLKLIIKGKWGGLKDTAATMSIDDNEIFYYDASASYPYSMSKGQIQIKYSDYNYFGQIIMIGRDTFIMQGSGKFKDDSDTIRRFSR